MAEKALHFCRHPGCGSLTTEAYCDVHAELHAGEQKTKDRERDRRRGSARERGYSSRWDRYSKAFLARPENKICKLHLDDGCTILADCVDHIDPPDGPGDPRFWDKKNHQPACIHCNSVKGHRALKGTFDLG